MQGQFEMSAGIWSHGQKMKSFALNPLFLLLLFNQNHLVLESAWIEVI